MHDDKAGHHSTGHHSDKNEASSIISENSIQDKLLTALAGLAMIALFLTGVYWQVSLLPKVQEEGESDHQSKSWHTPALDTLDMNPNDAR